MNLGGFGVWRSIAALSADERGEAAALAEELGFTAFWLGASPRVGELRPLLEASERLVVATSIVNVWTTGPVATAAEWAELERDFPGRTLIGIGAGHPELDTPYAKPLGAVRAYLDAIDAAPTPIPSGRRLLAALGPQMLDLCVDRSAGTVPYFVPVAHTRFARDRIGAGRLLAPELTCVVDEDRERARASAREFAQVYLGLANYVNAALAHGFGEEDIADGGSDRLIDAIVPQGSAVEIAAVARAHIEAGANHVVLQPVASKGIPRQEWTALAGELNG